MTTNWSNVFDHIQDFDLFGPDADKWNEWYSKFKIHAMVSGFFDLPDEEKVDVLLLKLKNFSALDIDIDGDPIAFEELLLKLGKHCTVTNFRQMFLNRRQLPGESFNDFAQGLQQLSLPCRFTDELIVRDVFISNMHKSHAVIANILGSLPDNPTLSETALLANYLLDDTRDPGYVVKQSALIFNLSGFQHRFWRHGKDSGDSAHTKHDKPDFRNDPHTISKQPALGAIRKGTTRYSDSGSTTTEFSETTSKASKNTNRVGKYDSQATSQRHLIGAPPFPLGEYHTVGVIHVISKDRVRVCPKEAISEFKELYNSLDTYYNEESHQRPLRTFKVGMTCVTNHEGVWHRARIDSIVSDNTTKLQLWDYGSEITVNNSNVLFIPKHFYTAPKHTFDICIGVAVKVGDMFEIALDQFKNEVWLSHLKNTCESSVEVARIKQNPDDSEPQERDDDVSPEPVPLNQYIEVLVIYRKPEGVLCVILKSKLAEVNKINVEVDNWFSEPGNQIVLKKRDKGAKCASLFNCSWYRAQITEVDTPSNSVKVYYYDFGNEELITDLTRLMVLPQKLAKMPVHLFQITPLSPVGDEYLLEVKLVGKESNGSWSAVVKGMEDEASSKMIAPDLTVTEPTTVGSDVGNPAHQYGVSSDNESASTMSVKIVNKSLTDGTLFAVLNHQLSDLQQMTNELLNAEKSPLIRPDIGVLCLAPYRKDGVDEWRRAEITQVNRTRTKVRVDFIDSGDKDQLMISQLRILPDKFQTLPPFAFEIEVPGRQIELGAALKVKPVSDDEGPLVVELEDCNNNGLVSRPSPPIPKDGLTEVQVIYHGSEGVFATRVDRLKQAAQMAAMIQEVAMTPLQSPPITGEVYLAPFDGDYYRAKVLSVNPSGCHMFYIDYGNQTDVQSEELRQLPPELATNIHEPLAIKLTVSNTKAVEDGCTLKVKPVFREDIGSWEIMMEDELSSGDDKYRLPDVSSAPTVPSHSNLPVYQPPTVRRLPKNTYSEVSVVYVGPEGTFAVCVNEISKMVNITEEVAALERIPLPLPPAVGEMCIAPYEGCYYRARIRSVLEESFCVEFVDYGNTDLVAPGQLMEIPLAYAQEIFTFKIEPVDGRSLSVGFEARVKPISVRSDGTTVVELAEDSNA